MSKVIDLYLDLPTCEEYYLKILGRYCLGDGKTEQAGYREHFGGKIAGQIGLTIKELDDIVAAGGEEAFRKTIKESTQKAGTITLDQFIKQLDDMNVSWGFTSTHDHNNIQTAEICAKYPDRLFGFAYIDPNKRMDAVRELEYCIKELKLSALYITAFRTGVPANDKKCYPLYAKACELGIPVFIYCSMNYSAAMPMDIGHPKLVDEVARDFPEMKIMASVSGWPWIMEMIGLALRHKNLCINMEVYDYANMAISGSGFEPLLYYVENKIQDKMCFASNWVIQGTPLQTLINQVHNLPLSDTVKEKLLYKNAAAFFGRE